MTLLRRALVAPLLLAVAPALAWGPAMAQVPLSSLPVLQGQPQPGDLFVIERLGAPAGQRTATVSAANVAAYVSAILAGSATIQSLAAEILAETQRAIAAEGSNSSALTAETSRAKAAEALLAPLASPALTGTPSAPTPALGDSSTTLATSAYVKGQGYVTAAGAAAAAPVQSVAGRTGAVALGVADVSGAAPLASPALTGTPTAPNAPAGTSTAQLATTAFTSGAVATEASRAQAAEGLAAQKSANLSDLASASSARSNLGLAAVAASGSASDLGTGTLPAGRLPAPTATAPGGVQALPASGNVFLTGIGLDGKPTGAQPSFSNLAGSATAAQMPAFTGDATSPAGSTALTLANSGAAAGSYLMASITVDAKGRVTAISNSALTGDVSSTAGSLATTINAGVVTNAKLASAPASTLKGNASGSAAAPSDLTPAQVKTLLAYAAAGANSDITSLSGLTTALSAGQGGTGVTTPAAELARIGAVSTGTTVSAGTGLTGGGALSGNVSLGIATAGVSNTLLANMPAGTVKANAGASAAAPADVAPSALLDAAFGSAQGGLLYRGASAWTLLGPGSAGQVLGTGGANANPAWQNGGGTGTVTSVGTGAGLTGGPITSSGTVVAADNLMQGRLTLASGTPVMTSAVTGATAVLYTPYTGNLVALWNGATFQAYPFSEYSQALSDTTYSPAAAVAGACYDEFAWLSGSTVRVTRGPAWTAGSTAGSNTARGSGAGSTALTRQNGMLVNQYAITNGPAAGYGTYLGTFCTDAGAATVTWSPGGAAQGGTPAALNLWNMHNRVPVSAAVQDTTQSWPYTNPQWRPSDGSTGNRVTYVNGQPGGSLKARAMTAGSVSAGYTLFCGVALDSTTAPSGASGLTPIASVSIEATISGEYVGAPGLGQHFVQAMERGQSGGTFYGSDANGQYAQLSVDIGGM